MKQILYFTIFFASVGTLGLVATNPKMVQQGAEYLGMAPGGSQESSATGSDDDHLAKFLSQYPDENKLAELTKPDTVPPPPIPPAPKVDPPQKPEPPKVEPPKIEPPKVASPPKPEPPKVEPPKIEPPKVASAQKPEPPKVEPPKIEPPKVASAQKPEPPKVDPPKKPESPKVEPPKKPEPPKIAPSPKPEIVVAPQIPVDPFQTGKQQAPPSVPAVPKPPVADPFATAPAPQPQKPVPQEPVPQKPVPQKPVPQEPAPQEPVGVAQTHSNPVTANTFSEPSVENAGFASSKHGAVPASAVEELEKWSEPTPIFGVAERPIPPMQPIYPVQSLQPAQPMQSAAVNSVIPSIPEPIAQNPPPQLGTNNPGTNVPGGDIPGSLSHPGSPQEKPNDLFLQALNSPQDNATNGFGTSPFVPQNNNNIPPAQSVPQIVAPPAHSVYVQPSQPQSNPRLPPNLPPSAVAQNTEMAMQQTSLSVPQAALPQAALPQPQPQAVSQIQVSPSIVAEEVPCYGTMMIARVGTQVILMCDILPQLRRAGIMVLNENLKKASEEELAQVTPQEKEKFVNMFVENQYPSFLQEQITVALVFNDYLLAKSREEREMFDKKFGEDFDQHEVAAMIKEFGVKNNVELKQYLKEKLGSSLDREKMLWVRSKIAQQWIMFNMQDASGECTHDEMMEFYTAHKDMFTSETRAQWLELFVAFSNHPTEEAARNKIAWLGNQVVGGGYPFEEIAKVNSEGFTASKGGLWDWTKKGSLSSQELEQAIFTLPIDKMSPIIKSEKGFHIIRVVKREESETTPFIIAQVTIREKIKMERRQKMQKEYFEELKKRYAVYIFKDHIDFDINRRETASRPASFF